MLSEPEPYYTNGFHFYRVFLKENSIAAANLYPYRIFK
jgi:hypothetical protein